jgi:cytochrome P450
LIWELLQHPDMLETVRLDIDSLPEKITVAADLENTPYLDAAILDTLRLHPTVPVATRSVSEAFAVGKYSVPRGMSLLPCIYLVHRDPLIWENPDTFRPERLIDQRPPSTHYFPFGGGLHHCPGSDMGFLQIKSVALTILRRREFIYAGKRPPRSRYVVAVIRPDNGVPVIAKKRDIISRPSDGQQRHQTHSQPRCPVHTNAPSHGCPR